MSVALHSCLIDIVAVEERDQVWWKQKIKVEISLQACKLDFCSQLTMIQWVGFLQEKHLSSPEI